MPDVTNVKVVPPSSSSGRRRPRSSSTTPGSIAQLADEDEASIVFSFTRSYFHVDLAHVGEVVLDRLVGADLAAELPALLDVVHRVGQQALELARALEHATTHVQHCERCNTFTEDAICALCRSGKRDATQLCDLEIGDRPFGIDHHLSSIRYSTIAVSSSGVQ